MNKLASSLAVVTMVLAACSPSSAAAATVDGLVITVDEVEALMADSGVVDRPTFSQFLGAAIQLQIQFAAAEADYGIVISDEEAAVEADLFYEANAVDQTREEFLEQAGISEAAYIEIMRQRLVNTAVQERLAEEVIPTQEEIDEAVQRAEWGIIEVCASHILVATVEEADAVGDRLEAGEEFAALALELSVDTGSGANGGDLGCSPASRYVGPFAEATINAEIGTPTEPVQSEFGFHVILVNDRTEGDRSTLPTEEQVVEDLKVSLVPAAFDEWLIDAYLAADVQVEEEFGTWNPGPPPEVTPPA